MKRAAAIVTDHGFEELARQGKLVPGSRADVAKSAMAVAGGTLFACTSKGVVPKVSSTGAAVDTATAAGVVDINGSSALPTSRSSAANAAA